MGFDIIKMIICEVGVGLAVKTSVAHIKYLNSGGH